MANGNKKGEVKKVPRRYLSPDRIIPNETQQNLTFEQGYDSKSPELYEAEKNAYYRNKNLSDFATNFLTLGTQFRYPTEAELERARSSRMGKAQTLAEGAAWGAADMLTGELTSVLPSAAKRVSRGAKKGINKLKQTVKGKSKANQLSSKEIKDFTEIYDPISFEKYMNRERQAEQHLKLLDAYDSAPTSQFSKEGDTFVKQWFGDNTTQRKLQQSGLSSDDLQTVLRNSNELESRFYPEELLPENAVGFAPQTKTRFFEPVHSDKWQQHLPKMSTISDKFVDKPLGRTIATHEGSHYILESEKYLPERVINKINRSFKGKADLKNVELKALKGTKWDYLTSPGEVHARVMQLREAAGVKPNDVFTEDHYNQAIKTLSDILGDQESVFGIKSYESWMKDGKNTIIKLANTLPMIGGVTVGKQKENGMQKKQKGGKVTDKRALSLGQQLANAKSDVAPLAKDPMDWGKMLRHITSDTARYELGDTARMVTPETYDQYPHYGITKDLPVQAKRYWTIKDKKQNREFAYPAYDTEDMVNFKEGRTAVPPDQEYSLGGILGETAMGAGSGALSGSVVGGLGAIPGALIGGGVGLTKGLLGHFQEKKAERAEEERLAAPQTAWAMGAQNMQQSYNPYTATFPMGGIIPGGQPNVELEKEEVTLAPDGSMAKVDAPSHAQGGIELNAEPGTRVFSDRLKAQSGKTFAEEADKIRKKMAKYEKTLS